MELLYGIEIKKIVPIYLKIDNKRRVFISQIKKPLQKQTNNEMMYFFILF
jgi:hypothetical protein